MRSFSLAPVALFALSVAVPVSAQVTHTTVNLQADLQALVRFQAGAAAPPRTEPKAKPELVVARLMSFDQNHDGRLTRAELPERMQALVAVGDVTRDEALDATEVKSLAER